MEQRTTIKVGLNDKVFKKLDNFIIENFVSASEVIRVLIQSASMKLDVKSRSILWHESRQNKNESSKNKNLTTFYLNNELIKKLNKLKSENKTSYTEIIKHLIETANFNKLNFKNKTDIYSIGTKYSRHMKNKK